MKTAKAVLSAALSFPAAVFAAGPLPPPPAPPRAPAVALPAPLPPQPAGRAIGEAGPHGKVLLGLSATQRADFATGRAEFVNVETPEGGLGPIFNDVSCVACHFQGGVGGGSRVVVTRFGRVTDGVFDPLVELGGPLLQRQAIAPAFLETVPAAANVVARRMSTPLFGAGLIEAIPDATLTARAALVKPDGVKGKAALVQDVVSGSMRVGRFGWKANQPSIKQQVASAFLADIGINSAIYPEQSCTPVQKECLAAISGKEPELRDELWEPITFWSQSLDVPAQRNRETAEFKTGEKLFESAGCSGCHVPEMRTGKYAAVPQLSNKLIRPYTDLLLHDMGPDLADGRPDFKASGSDWRTPPLWGVGLSMQVNASNSFLHDGRARNLLEAIVWHGGEAKTSRDKFIAFTKKQRDELIYFLSSI